MELDHEMALFNGPLDPAEQAAIRDGLSDELCVRLRRLAKYDRIAVSEDEDGKPILTASSVSRCADGRLIVWFDFEYEGYRLVQL